MNNIKKINIKEFRELGYLQEVNRLFFHPLGLSLEIIQDEDGTEELDGIGDYRTSTEGLYFDLKNSDKETIQKFKEKAQYIDKEFREKSKNRNNILGFVIEPISGYIE